ncbi:MAG: S8 family serine peptidase [Deltaproteobacteria bacterium]|nr:S8 family serine peptidase [Deltaproteobacteria bacterium]
MKANKALTALCFILVFLVISPVFGDELTNPKDLQENAQMLTQPSSAVTKTFSRDRLLDVARTQGYVRVIVQIAVPDIDKLTAASTAVKVISPGEKAPDQTMKADAELADMISSVTLGLLSNLQGVYYQVNHTYQSIPFVALNVSEQALLILESLPDVVSIAEDRAVPLPEPVPAVNADRESSARGVSVGVIGADKAWQMGYTGAGWYVAILDTGIRETHEFFAGKTLVEACYAGNSNCPNGQTTMTGPGSAALYASSLSGYDHGTHVAGIAAGKKADNSILGVAKDANIIAVKVFSIFTSDTNCGAGHSPCILSYTSDQILGLQFVYNNRSNFSIASVNMSIGGGTKYSDQSLCDTNNAAEKAAIDNLRAVGIATLIASGNESYCNGIDAPGCISSAIAVGATDDSDVQASFSNWDPNLLDVYAPGVSINSSIGTSDTSYGLMSGTSMATPHMTGCFALLKQKNSSLSVTQLFSAVNNTGVPISTFCATGPLKPRIQVDAALLSIPGPSSNKTEFDFNGDGKADILWRNGSSGSIWMYFMNGTSIGSQGSVGFVSDPNWKIQGLGDFNGDGKADILFRHAITGQVWMYLMNGTAVSSQGPVATVSDLNWSIQGVGDFNGDGKADVLWKNAATGQIWIWLMNGTSISSQGSVGFVGDSNWKIQRIGDFNGDGKADILFRHATTGQVWMYLMNGISIASEGSVANVSNLSWQIQGVGDFNGDGKSDILWFNVSTGQLWMYLMNGISIGSQGQVGVVGDLNWKIKGIGDFNGDAKADILFRHATTGQVWMYLMNGISISSDGSVANVSDLNWQTQLIVP